jgi:hypothetical protein
MRSPKKKAASSDLRSWRVLIQRDRVQYLGVVEAPTERVAAAVAVAQFSLTEEQRRRLVVQERD